MANQTVSLQVTDIITAVDGDYPICDATYRKLIAGFIKKKKFLLSFLFFRNFGVFTLQRSL